MASCNSGDMLRLGWGALSEAAEWPEWVEIEQQKVSRERVDDGLSVTFINHATFLIQVDGLNILTDPVYSERVSPSQLVGPRRVHAPGVRLEDPVPVCIVCGQPVAHKPGHMSQLDSGHFGPKTAPRFFFRGKMDTLHAQFLLAVAQAQRFNLPDLADYLTSLAAYCREITSAEYNQRQVAPLQLAGLTEAQIRERTHWPERTLGLSHVVPGPGDHELLLQLNLLRCQTRETELVTASVFSGPDGQPTRPDLMQALNRLSSAVYYLVLLLKAGKITWKTPAWLGQSR